MALKIFVNTQVVNDLPKSTNPSDFVEMNQTNDKFIFSAGSDTVKDGEPIPTPEQLTAAGLLITTSDVEVPHFFLADASSDPTPMLKEIHNAGNQDKRYVFCVAFDAATASEPILELWDDTDLDTILNYCLGAGVANNSFFRGIVTTDALPGVRTWSRLAGSGVTHFLWLNNENGELTIPKDLYFTLRITVPANFSNAASEVPVFAIKYTSN
jgi:hypothetical protein